MPKPILQSLILADHVYEDKLTGKRIIAGVFNRIIRGVRVLKEVAPPAPAPSPTPPPYQPTPAPQLQPQQQPAPFQPSAPIQVHSGQTIPESSPAPTSPSASPNEVSYPSAPEQSPPVAPVAPVAPAPIAPTAAAPHASPAAQPVAPTPPSEPTPTPSSPPAHTPPQNPPLQPGQRVLEIPPTGLQSGSPFAYLSLTEVRGVTPLMLQLVNLDDDSQLFRSDLRVDCSSPLYTVELTVPLPPISPPQAGIYALELLYNNELLGALRIVVEDAAQ